MAEGQSQRLSSLIGRYRLCFPSGRKVKIPVPGSDSRASVVKSSTKPRKTSLYFSFSPKFKFGKILRTYRRGRKVAPLPLPSTMDTIAEEDPPLESPTVSDVPVVESVINHQELQLTFEDLLVHTTNSADPLIPPVDRHVETPAEPETRSQGVSDSAPSGGEVKYPLRFQRYKSLLPPELDTIPGSWGFLQKPVISASEGNLRSLFETKENDRFLIPVQTPSLSHWNDKITSNFDCIVSRQRTYKIVVIGDSSTGKTSIIRRLTHQCSSKHYRATVGVDFGSKTYRYGKKQTFIRAHFWDLAGQERFTNMTRVYYREAVAAFLVFDATRPATLASILKWKEDLDSKIQLQDGSPIPCVLLVNKCDQISDEFASPYNLADFCQKNGILRWFPTSALDNINVDESAEFLLEKVVQTDQSVLCNKFSDSIKLDVDATRKCKKLCC